MQKKAATASKPLLYFIFLPGWSYSILYLIGGRKVSGTKSISLLFLYFFPLSLKALSMDLEWSNAASSPGYGTHRLRTAPERCEQGKMNLNPSHP